MTPAIPRLRATALLATAGLCLLAAGPRRPWLVYNLTRSVPVGLYLSLAPSTPRVGNLVVASPPEAVRRLAAERGYLPPTVPLVKRIVAVHGATVCANGDRVTVDGRRVANRLSADRQGRSLRLWNGCRSLAANEIFLLMANVPDSFDSRYFGPLQTDAVIGRLVPLWLH